MSNKEKMKIALIAKRFYPSIRVSAKRAVNIYRYLNEFAEIDLDVFTDYSNKEEVILNRSDLDPRNVKYIRVSRNKIMRSIFQREDLLWNIIHKTLFRGREDEILAKAVKRAAELSQYDLFYLTMPPFYPFLRLALFLKSRYPSKKVIVEYRDEWIDGLGDYASRQGLIHQHDKLKSIYRKWLNLFTRYNHARFEKKVLPRLDAVVVVTEEMKKYFLERIPDLSPEKIHFVPHGYDDTDIRELSRLNKAGAESDSKRLTIIYAGELYALRDIRPLLNAVRDLIDDGRIQRSEIEFNIFGRNEEYARLLPDNLKSLVSFRSSLPRVDIFNRYYQHDLLLLVIGDWPKSDTTMTGKIFELIASGRPILALLPLKKNGCAISLLKKTNSAYFADITEEKNIRESILALIALKREGRGLEREQKDMDWFFRRYHYRSICRELYGLMNSSENR